MASPLRICFAASELAPFAKTGGLADVAAALPRQLHLAGHDVRPFLPLYGSIERRDRPFVRVDFAQNVEIRLAWRTYRFSLWTTQLTDDGPHLYLVDCPELFHRPELYTSDADEPQRFVAFSRAVLESCQRMGFAPDVLHCNDWHTALMPLLLRTVYDWDKLFQRTRTLLTVHNIGYQGNFGAEAIEELGLGAWTHMFDQQELRAGRVNFLRTGLVYADLLSTVSPTYAREIQTPEYGMGLDTVLRARSERLVGVLNGVDYSEWSPESDPYIPHHYSPKRLDGKQRNQQHLRNQVGLADGDGAPLVGIVSRLVHQKGFDLCYPVLPEALATTGLQLVVVGSGERDYETFFSSLQRLFPGRAVFYRGYSNELAHLVEAGADMFLMPSRYEPCGLNQMFSMRYGTVPVVRRTGGLADSVRPFDIRNGKGTGFVFDHYTADGLRWALGQALSVHAEPPAWRRLMRNGMAEDFSWSKQAEKYVELYAWLRG